MSKVFTRLFLVSWSMLSAFMILANVVLAHAQLATFDELPDPKQVDTYTYNMDNKNGPRTKYNDKGYLTVGNGEFDLYSLIVTIESPTPDVWIKIEHAAACKNIVNGTDYTGVDAPLPDGGVPRSTFYFGSQYSQEILDRPGKIQTFQFYRDCGNPDRKVKLTNLEPIKVDGKLTGMYGGWMYARLDYFNTNEDMANNKPNTYSSLQNSFRLGAYVDKDLTTKQTRAKIGYSMEIAEALKKANRDLLAYMGVHASEKIGISLANTDLPKNSISDYSLGVSVPCDSKVTNRTRFIVTFYDIDDLSGSGLGNDSGRGGFWQGTSKIPSIEFEIRESHIRNLSAYLRGEEDPVWSSYSNKETRTLTGEGSGRNDEKVEVLTGFEKNHRYQFIIHNLYVTNAIQFGVVSDGGLFDIGSEEGSACPYTNENDPIGSIDECKLVDGVTVIYGWAYDNNAGRNTNRPKVRVKVGGDNYEANANIDNYRESAVEDQILNRGMDSKDGSYGFRIQVPGLSRAGPAPGISGIVEDVGAGSNQDLSVNTRNKLEDGTRVIGFPSSRIPDECIPPPAVANVYCDLLGFGADEDEIVSQFSVRVYNKSPASIGRVYVTSLQMQNLSSFEPSGRDMLVNYNDSDGQINNAKSREFVSPRGKYTRPIHDDNVKAVVNFRYTSGGTTFNREESCRTAVDINHYPYLKVFGGDIWASGGYNGSCSNTPESIRAYAKGSGTNYSGASAQLGVTALLGVKGLYSSSHRDSANQAPKGSTFANNVSAREYGGNFDTSSTAPGICMRDYPSTFKSAGSLSFNSGAGLQAGTKQYTQPAGDLTNNNLTINTGVQAAVYVNGNVYIRHNIVYRTGGRGTDVKNIPSLTIIAKGNIFIDHSVTRLDGLYIAYPNTSVSGSVTNGKIYTCTNYNSLFSLSGSTMYDNCGSQLVVNGGLIARQIRYLRTFGTLRESSNNETINFATGAGTRAAEIINFSPEMYLAPSPIKDPNSPNEADKYDAVYSLPPVF